MFHRLIAIAAVLCLTTITLAADGPKHPNVVFIMADDLGWADITPYGSTFHETPNLKRLADRSVRVTNYYAASPLCSPTRSSILTGLYPARTGITAPVCHLPQVQLEKRLAPGNANQRVRNADSVTRLKTEYVTLAEVLKQAGYATAHFGKWHLGHGAGYEPRDQGFDVDIPHTPNAAGPGGGYLNPWKFIKDPQYKGQPGQHIDDWMAEQAGQFIRQNKDKPFYVNFWMYSVHSPWNAKEELIEKYKKTADPKAAQRNPLYAAMIKSMDDAVGKLLDSLDAAGVADNTIIVFTSDNGGWAYPPKQTTPAGYEEIPATSNAPLRSGKASNYEGGTRVPCLVSWPGKTKPRATDAMFSSVDWFATLSTMTGVSPKQPVKHDGIDQTPAITGEAAQRDVAYCHFPHGSAAQEKNIPGFWPASWVRKGDWKLIRFYCKNADGSDLYELYNLKDDIGETRNRAEAEPAVVQQLRGLLDAFLRDTDAVIPQTSAAPAAAAAAAGPWTSSKDATVTRAGAAIVIKSSGKDPFITTRDVPAGAGPYTVELRMKSDSSGGAQVFWTTADEQNFHRDRSVVFTPTHDGAAHDYSISLKTEKPLTAIRIDPSNAAGEVQIERLQLKGKDGKVLKDWTAADSR